jgi:serine/threonine-protein kinase
MYHLMTGRLPYPGDSPLERLSKRIGGRPMPIKEVRPDLPTSLVQVMDKLLAHKPQDRFQSAAEAAEALQSFLRPRVKSTPRPPAKEPAPPPLLPAPDTPPVIKLVRPEYPGWFKPVAALAEENPPAALLATLAVAAALFAAGFGLARLLG